MRRLTLICGFIILSVPGVLAQADCTRHAEPTGGFSYCQPVGWVPKINPGMKYHRFFAPAGADGRSWANFNVRDVVSDQTLAEFVQANVNDLTTPRPERNPSVYKVISRTDITTASKIKGVRLVTEYEVQGRQLQAISYMFNGKAGTKLLFSATILVGDAATPKLLDAMIGTLRFDS